MRTDESRHISLGQAAQLAPGRPSTNAVWRWCRRGVIARSGQRVRLQHVRAGGKIFTTAEWVEAFCAALADADSAYFDAKDEAAGNLPPRSQRFGPPARRSTRSSPSKWSQHKHDDLLDREFEEEGL